MRKFAWQAAGRCSVKPDAPEGDVCTCGHSELSHHTVDGVPCGPCLYRGCECKALNVPLDAA
jgi:hypothetical protein